MKFSNWKAKLDHHDFLPFMSGFLPDNFEEYDKGDRIKAWHNVVYIKENWRLENHSEYLNGVNSTDVEPLEWRN